ncbi:hypothetical protein AX16_009061 [Volvariella volvacea WC 439]|nr:hypothetical protein AX16_009061 [Volvariella volvacea WC 439]
MFDPAKPGSEVQRARNAIAAIVRAAVECLSTIPPDSEARRHSKVFEHVNGLLKLQNMYMDQDGNVEEWEEFWDCTQFNILCLNEELKTALSAGAQSIHGGREGYAPEKTEASKDAPGIPPEFWLHALESAATAPWSTMYPDTHETRLAMAHAQVYQIFLYLERPNEPVWSKRYNTRKSTAILARTLIDSLSTIPMDSEVRAKYSGVFECVDMLAAVRKEYLTDEGGIVKDWTAFWKKARSELKDIGFLLHEAGFEVEWTSLEDIGRT